MALKKFPIINIYITISKKDLGLKLTIREKYGACRAKSQDFLSEDQGILPKKELDKAKLITYEWFNHYSIKPWGKMSSKKAPDFQKAKKNRVFQDVVDQIQEAILDQRLTPGDVLPPERKLRETFNISRGTLREALRVLEQKGLIEIRVGTTGGSVVRQAGMEQLTETFALLIRSGSLSVMEVGQFRTGVEGKTAALAAQRASALEIKILETMLKKAEQMNARGNDGWEDFLDIDQEIHKELAKISKNSLYILVSGMIHDNIRQYYDKFLENTPGRMAENLKDLEEMVFAVKNHLPQEAERVAENHVHKFIVHMKKKEALLANRQPKATAKP